jgi:hypothetical protein
VLAPTQAPPKVTGPALPFDERQRLPRLTRPAPIGDIRAQKFSTQEINFFTVGDDLISDATTLRRIKLKWWQRIGIPRR